MILVEYMAHLVQHDIVDLVFGGHDKPDVETEMVIRGAASPAFPYIPDPEVRNGDVQNV